MVGQSLNMERLTDILVLVSGRLSAAAGTGFSSTSDAAAAALAAVGVIVTRRANQSLTLLQQDLTKSMQPN